MEKNDNENSQVRLIFAGEVCDGGSGGSKCGRGSRCGCGWGMGARMHRTRLRLQSAGLLLVSSSTVISSQPAPIWYSRLLLFHVLLPTVCSRAARKECALLILRCLGAAFFDVDEVADRSEDKSPSPHMLPSAGKFSEWMRQHGIAKYDETKRQIRSDLLG